MRSMIGVTCSARDRGWLSLNHRVALNLAPRQKNKPHPKLQTSQRALTWLRLLVLLDFTGQFDGPSDVSAVQLELGVKVLLGGDGGGVVRAGTLGHVALVETPDLRKVLQAGACVCRRGSYPVVSGVLFSNAQEGLQRCPGA